MVGAGRDLCGSPSPTLLPKQGHPEQAAEGLVQVGLEYLQRRRLNAFLISSRDLLTFPHVKFQRELLAAAPSMTWSLHSSRLAFALVGRTDYSCLHLVSHASASASPSNTCYTFLKMFTS